MSEQPALDDRTLVSAGVVEHEMQIQLGRRGMLDGLQEVAELHAAVAPMDLGDDRSSLDVQGGEEVSRAVADVVVGMTLELARSHGNCWRGIAVGLDGGFLVYAQHQCPLGRMQIEAHNVSHLVDEVRVGGEFEALGAMRRQGEGTPDARDGGLAQPQMGRERAGGPGGGVLGHGLRASW